MGIDHTEITGNRREVIISDGNETVEVVTEKVEVISVAAAELRKVEEVAAAQAQAIAGRRGEEPASGQEEPASNPEEKTALWPEEKSAPNSEEESAPKPGKETAFEPGKELSEIIEGIELDAAESEAADFAEAVSSAAEAELEFAAEAVSSAAEAELDFAAAAASSAAEAELEFAAAAAGSAAEAELEFAAAAASSAEETETAPETVATPETEAMPETEALQETKAASAAKPLGYDKDATVHVIGVRFKNAGKVFYFNPGELTVRHGTHVIVETVRGIEYGTVAGFPMDIKASKLTQPLKDVIRIATPEDDETERRNRAKEKEAYRICQEKIRQHGLEMKLINAEYTFDNSKVLFYFTADGRVDFRDLVKDLASVFRTRIELRQIGVRDETKILGGYGICGRPLCCHTWMSDFIPVSIKMAKEQNLSLNPGKISGVCGRLMCCLKNEAETYEELNRSLPKVGDEVQGKDGLSGLVESVNVLRQTVRILVDVDDEKEYHEYHVDDLTVLRRRRRGGGRARKDNIDSKEAQELEKLESQERQNQSSREKGDRQNRGNRQDRGDRQNRGDNQDRGDRQNRGDNQNRGDRQNRGDNGNRDNRSRSNRNRGRRRQEHNNNEQ